MREVEPLAANISGDNVAVVLRKLQNEFIRLAAAILGCPYDALWQREKRYRQKRISALLGGAAVIAAVFAGMLVKKNADIEEQYRHSQKNESYALALLSAQYLKDGTVMPQWRVRWQHCRRGTMTGVRRLPRLSML